MLNFNHAAWCTSAHCNAPNEDNKTIAVAQRRDRWKRERSIKWQRKCRIWRAKRVEREEERQRGKRETGEGQKKQSMERMRK